MEGEGVKLSRRKFLAVSSFSVASLAFAGAIEKPLPPVPNFRLGGRTLFESDHGAAIKVEMRKGQTVTVVNPDFEAREWCGFVGEIVGTPFLPVCRTQIEVKVKADAQKVISAMRGFHCMVAYGDYRKEIGYALSKVGIGWVDSSESD